MTLGGSWGQDRIPAARYDAARDAMHAAHRAGITLFDHADIYIGGDSETVFGRILAEDAELRRDVQVQTKCGIRLPGNTAPEGSPVHYRLDRDTVRSSLEGSLERLGLDRVERLFVHRPDPLTPVAATAAALDELHDEGLIGSVGLSNVTPHHVVAFQHHLRTPVTAVQLQLSLAHRDFVESQVLANHPDGTAVSFPGGLLAQCAAEEIEIQAWGALAGGMYSGAPATGGTAGHGAAALVAELAERMGLPREAVVVGWLLRHPYGIRPVVGTLDPQRIAACAQAPRAAELMTHEDWYALWTAARGRPLP
ncbi:aldo/keto reductase [Kocuria tytonis]|uniref:Aldo/keto reductase n=2 Tax=Kocuria tytonis TaxID=2054280 RepID=A0A495A2W4_9MICC|nr:aldo/keto reductase [Kocuria tytonis]